MWMLLRKTARRGRDSVPSRWRRIRSWRLRRAAPRLAPSFIVSLPSWVLLLAADLAGLAGLSADLLARVANALALVRLRLAGRPDLRGDLADELLVDPDYGEAGRILELERDALGRVDLDLVAIAE